MMCIAIFKNIKKEQIITGKFLCLKPMRSFFHKFSFLFLNVGKKKKSPINVVTKL